VERTIPLRLLHRRAPGPAACVSHIGRFIREAPSCGEPVSTAKTTVLPAEDRQGRQKGLHFSLRLDDGLDPKRTYSSAFPRTRLNAAKPLVAKNDRATSLLAQASRMMRWTPDARAALSTVSTSADATP
jgi:hypothetical protein